MNLKTKVKSYSFWVSLASAVILILKLVGQKFGFSVDEGLISDLFTSLCAILVITGIIVVPSSSSIEQKVVDDKIISCENQIIETQTNEENFTQEDEENKETIDKIKEISDTVQIENQNADLINDLAKVEVFEQQKDEVDCENVNQISEINSFVSLSEANQLEENNFSEASFNLESFIDKVCTKRNELSGNVMNFVEFLQNEIDNIKNK